MPPRHLPLRTSLEESSKGLLDQDERIDNSSVSSSREDDLLTLSRPVANGRRLTLAAFALLVISNTVTLLALFFIMDGQQRCPSPLNQPPGGVAPSLAHLATTPSPHFVNVSWFPDGQFFREHNSDEADHKWKEYDGSFGGYVFIPKEEAEAADINPERHAYIDRPDLGAVGYPVLPEAIHHMHCVNMLRRNLYYNIEHTRKSCKPGSPTCEPPSLESWRIQHVDHCLEIVRNRIACTADLGIVPFMWYGPNGKLAGDMARMHTCSNNYESVRDFVLTEGRLPGETEGILKPPPGAFITNLRN